MPLAFFRKAERLCLVQPAFMHSACQASSLVFWSAVRLRLAKLLHAALLDALFAQQAFPPANMGEAMTSAAATNADKVVLIMAAKDSQGRNGFKCESTIVLRRLPNQRVEDNAFHPVDRRVLKPMLEIGETRKPMICRGHHAPGSLF